MLNLMLDEVYLEEDRIREVIEVFSNCTDIPVTFFDKEMDIKIEFAREKKICQFFNRYNNVGICSKSLAFSADMSYNLGEPYICVCPSGFVNICISVIKDKTFHGVVIAGPISMWTPDEKDYCGALYEEGKNKDEISVVNKFAQSLKMYTPKQITSLATLLNNNILSIYNNREQYETINEAYKEQIKIGEKIHKYKKEHREIEYPYEKEKELIKKVKSGDCNGSVKILKGIMNDILLVEAGNFEVIKARVFELCVILSRASIEGGASLRKIFGMNFDLIHELNEIKTLTDLRKWAENITEHFSQNVFNKIYQGQSYIIFQAIQHINANYMNKISLKKLANYLHVNESYFSKLFKQEMSISFTDYLREVRIKRSAELIRETNMDFLDIALYVGFEDQSYFTKNFKRIIGFTPMQYRKNNN